MGMTAVRALVQDVQLRALGVPAVVSVPDGPPVQTRVLWVTPMTEALPDGFEIRRKAARKAMAIARSAVPVVPLKTLIAAPETDGGPVLVWRVDGFDLLDVIQTRVFVVQDN